MVFIVHSFPYCDHKYELHAFILFFFIYIYVLAISKKMATTNKDELDIHIKCYYEKKYPLGTLLKKNQKTGISVSQSAVVSVIGNNKMKNRKQNLKNRKIPF